MKDSQKKKQKKTNKILEDYNKQQLAWKTHIRLEPSKKKKFWMWIWYFIAFPFVWIWANIRDWRTALIFGIVFLVLSSEVWVPYLIGIILHNAWFLSVGTACWLFWLGPGTPFLVIVITVTIFIKSLFNKGRK